MTKRLTVRCTVSLFVRRREGCFAPPARPTFVRGDKSRQKHHLNLRFKDPRTLFILLDCNLIPRVRGTRLLSLRITYRFSSCAAAAHSCDGRTKRVVRRVDVGIAPYEPLTVSLCRGRCPHRPARWMQRLLLRIASAAAALEQRRFNNSATTGILRERVVHGHKI